MARVCVTGGTGFLASWLIKLLLERGYVVRATVRDPGNHVKTAHLHDLPYAKERLELVKADLLDVGCFDSIVDGCEGVFHIASPISLGSKDAGEDLVVKTAIEGTLNVLNACAKSKSVKRVVLTSSIIAALKYDQIESQVVDDSSWSDESFWKARKNWYGLSKLLAEKAAWSFAKERGIDLVTIIPGTCAGRPLQSTLDIGSQMVLTLLTGKKSHLLSFPQAWVDVRDVVEAHVLAFEVPTASGRYLCAERVMDFPALLEVIQKVIPPHLTPSECNEKERPSSNLFQVSIEKTQGLGLAFRPIENALKETISCLLERGLLS